MDTETITLLHERTGPDSRLLQARYAKGGDLLIEGQDLGPTVEAFWGPGNTEYEWGMAIKATDFAVLTKALDGDPGEDVLALLARRFREDPDIASKSHLDASGVPIEFWSRVGD